jgi:hypothetical protein
VATTRAESSADRELKKPITGIAGCCARAASGQAAALATSVMSSRRLMCSPQAQDHTLPHRRRNAALCITANLILAREMGQIRSFGDVGSVSGLPPESGLKSDIC